MLAAGSSRVVPTQACLLQSTAANAILQELDGLLARTRLTPYNTTRGYGFLKRVGIREGMRADPAGGDRPAFMVTLVTASTGTRDEQAALRSVAAALAAGQPDVRSVLQCIHTSANAAAPSASEVVLHGNREIHTRVRDLLFRVSADSFFQVNTHQAVKLFDAVLAAAELRPSDTVLDLFCGTGAIALWVAHHCRSVLGVEVTEAAVADARANAHLNNIRNVTFRQGDLSKSVGGLGARPDVVIADPARAGLSAKLVRFLRMTAPRRIVYASCNSQTLLRDLRLLCSAEGRGQAFTLRSLQPVDMFPHTDHLEAIAVLTADG